MLCVSTAAITMVTQTVTGAHTDGGFVEVDATNCKGLYRLDLPDAAVASGAFTIISIEFDGIIEESLEIDIRLPDVNNVPIENHTTSARGDWQSWRTSEATGRLWPPAAQS